MNLESDSQQSTPLVEHVVGLRSGLLSYVEAERSLLDMWGLQVDNLIALMSPSAAFWETMEDVSELYTLRQTLLALRQELVRQQKGLRFILPTLHALTVPNSLSTLVLGESSLTNPTESSMESYSSEKLASSVNESSVG
jgi:hypothetical protein